MMRFEDSGRTVVVFKRIGCFAAIILSAASAPERALAYWTNAPSGALKPAPLLRGAKIKLVAPLASPVSDDRKPILLAHAIVVRTSPAQGGVADASIGKVDVWYDAGIRDAFAALAVVSASGERVDKRDAAIDSGDPAHVSVSVNALTAGKYTVRYRALSADGHLVSGAWEFEVRP
jgi:methionine-rich copper-binding protein CopC